MLCGAGLWVPAPQAVPLRVGKCSLLIPFSCITSRAFSIQACSPFPCVPNNLLWLFSAWHTTAAAANEECSLLSSSRPLLWLNCPQWSCTAETLLRGCTWQNADGPETLGKTNRGKLWLSQPMSGRPLGRQHYLTVKSWVPGDRDHVLRSYLLCWSQGLKAQLLN